jgi:hypothetical protein
MAVSFNEKALLADLKIWWEQQVGEDDPFGPRKPDGTIMDVLPQVDSLAIVCSLVIMERHLPCKVPLSVIRRGGYLSFEDMTQDMLPKLRGLICKHVGEQRHASPERETA